MTADISKNTADAKYFGRKDICLLCEHTAYSLFPLPKKAISRKTASQESISDPPSIGEWLAYVFYRTALPLQTIFHALHLLNRLSATYSFSTSEIDAPLAKLVHHRLIFTALVLATKYSMDDCYSNRSFAIASKGLFSLRDVNEMELEMMGSLDYRLGSTDLKEIVESYISEWEEKLARDKEIELERRRASKLAAIQSPVPHRSTPTPTQVCQPFKRKRTTSGYSRDISWVA